MLYDKAYCINLNYRKDRYKTCVDQFRKRKMKVKMVKVFPNPDPQKGCIESHLNIINEAINDGFKSILIMEDDVDIKINITNLPSPPSNWDMLYLGGTVRTVKEYEITGKDWVRVTTWNAHGYIINLENENLVKAILEAQHQSQPYDYYLESCVHPYYNVYMINPMRVFQKPGFSDIAGVEVDYKYMELSLRGFKKPEYENIKGEYVLKMPNIEDDDLPMVSILTPTYNRRDMFAMAIRNFQKFNYPSHKLEWIIIDDSKESIKDIIPPNDYRIKYYKLKTKGGNLTVGKKRNICNKMAKGEYRIHMDDDDYYPPESVLCRVKMLMKYKSEGIHCVGCSQLGVYDLINNRSTISSDSTLSLSEASMGYSKYFWLTRQFPENIEKGEYIEFIKDRFESIMDLPYVFVLYAITHNTNLTNSLRNLQNSDVDTNIKMNGKIVNYIELWDENTVNFMTSLKNKIIKNDT